MSADAPRQRLVRELAAVARGERAALHRVYGATSAKLYGVCLRILRDEQEAEDALQDVYLTVWRRAGTFDPERASPITWLAVVARNRALDRRRAMAALHLRPLGREAEQVSDAAEPADALLERHQATSRLNVCLETLSAQHAASVRGAFFDGRTYAELAADAEVPLSTMKSWIRRALQRLKTCLEA